MGAFCSGNGLSCITFCESLFGNDSQKVCNLFLASFAPSEVMGEDLPFGSGGVIFCLGKSQLFISIVGVSSRLSILEICIKASVACVGCDGKCILFFFYIR